MAAASMVSINDSDFESTKMSHIYGREGQRPSQAIGTARDNLNLKSTINVKPASMVLRGFHRHPKIGHIALDAFFLPRLVPERDWPRSSRNARRRNTPNFAKRWSTPGRERRRSDSSKTI